MDIHGISFEQHLAAAEAFHGHLCGGILTGVRMALRGLREIGIHDPKGEDAKRLMVFVEIDRCATDAITSVTGCRPGKRTMKIKDFGKMAATFLNLETRQAIRIASRGKMRPGHGVTPEAAIQAATDEELFWVRPVTVPLGPGDLPGPPIRSVVCARCRETVLDLRDRAWDGQTLCRPCFEGRTYFQEGPPA